MPYVAVDKDGSEWSFSRQKPHRDDDMWVISIHYLQRDSTTEKPLKKGSIEKLIGYKLTWEDEPVELKEIV